MKLKETNPFLPPVTEAQICAFDASRPETYTGEALVDAILTAFSERGAMTAGALAKYLELPATKLSNALEILTGHRYSEFHDLWFRHRYEQLKADHPYWGPDELARRLGFRDRTAIWHLLHRDVRQKEYAKLKSHFESLHPKYFK